MADFAVLYTPQKFFAPEPAKGADIMIILPPNYIHSKSDESLILWDSGCTPESMAYDPVWHHAEYLYPLSIMDGTQKSAPPAH